MNRKTKLIVYGIAALLLLSGFFYFVFRGTNEWKAKLPVLAYVQPFSFVNQLGDTVTQQQTAGKIYIANYFFVTCTGICPHMNGNVKKLYQQLADQPNMLFLSHTCQPELDSVPVLKRYADSIGSDGKRWLFLTGNKLALYRTARESYHVDDPQNNVGDINDQFLHSQFLALVDAKGQLRGIYDGLKSAEIKQLQADVKLLTQETDRNGFVNSLFGNAPTK